MRESLTEIQYTNRYKIRVYTTPILLPIWGKRSALGGSHSGLAVRLHRTADTECGKEPNP